MPHCLMNLRGRVMVFDAFQYLRVLREHWQLFLLHPRPYCARRPVLVLHTVVVGRVLLHFLTTLCSSCPSVLSLWGSPLSPALSLPQSPLHQAPALASPRGPVSSIRQHVPPELRVSLNDITESPTT